MEKIKIMRILWLVNQLIGEIPIGKIPIGKIPIGKIPIGEIPIGKIPIGELPIGKIPIDGHNHLLPEPVLLGLLEQIL